MHRIILHIDMNSYFASVEQQANPFLRGKPIGITGKDQERSVVATASIEAKKLGVKTAMSTWEAKKICPSLILYAGDPEKYSDIMHRFNAIYQEFTPHVEPFSVDESFLDITEEAEDFFGATYMAQMIRTRLKEELGNHITASIGIAPNKLMAKLACETVKPSGLTVVQPEELIDLLNRCKLDDLCGIGPRILKRLHALDIKTFAELRACPLEDLQREFKSYGLWLHEAAYGRDSSQGVNANSSDAKSYGHSYTLPENTQDQTVLKRYLFGLADKVGWRMRRDGVVARRITAHVRFGDFTSHSEQRTVNTPTADGMDLFKISWNIVKPLLTSDVRLVGLSASMLTKNPSQPSLFKKERNMQSVLCALDSLQHRYGTGVWKRGATLPLNLKQRSSGFHFDHEV
ncbi:DNA polymerase IV [Candidatus Uhrbacteria bacterium]|nr:DNA polymerase IV [Candidatus Uhrbacteria bacterium]